MIEQTLHEIGLTENETKIYMALLELGESTSGQIIEKAKVKTGRLYDILGSLKEKGFISEVLKNKVKRFSPAEPSMILEFLKKKKNELEAREKQAAVIIPEILAKIKLRSPKTKIEVYTGFEGMKNAYLKEINRYDKTKEVLIIGEQTSEAYDKKTNYFFKYKVYKERALNNIKIRKIKDEKSRESISKENRKNVHVRYMFLPYLTTITIVEDLVIIGIFIDNGVFITIENNVVDDSFRAQFESLWKTAKK